MSGKAAQKFGSSASALRIGFVPLVDAGPLIVAEEMGYFGEEGLHVVLHRQIGWGNIRDKHTFGHLDASHALLGMAPISVLGKDQFAEPLVAIASLGSGGNAITLSRNLTAMGVTSAEALARHVKRREGKKLLFAHVFSCSAHHYLLREWLSGAGIDPDEDVRLCVLPPPQMPRHLAGGFVDGFCVGDPWNTLAEHEQTGTIVIPTTRVVPDHPEKVLAVSRRWLANHQERGERLVRAVLRGCAFCNDPANIEALSRILAAPQYLDVPQEVLARSLSKGPEFRSWAAKSTFPSVSRAVWLLMQMQRWRHLPMEMDLLAVARQAVDAGPYRAAAASLGWPCPVDDLPPMRQRSRLAAELARG